MFWAKISPQERTPPSTAKAHGLGVNKGPIAGISTNADWIWFDQFVDSACPSGTIDAAGNYTSSLGGYAVFRYEVVPSQVVASQVVPIPASALLLGSGLLGLGLLGWRRQRLIG